MDVRSRIRGVKIVGPLTVLLVAGTSVGLASAAHDAGETMHLCVGAGGNIRHTTEPCRANEEEYVVVTQAGLAALRAAIEAADSAHDARLDALEATDADHQAQIDALMARVAAIEPTDVAFTKIFDGDHYASYNITGTGFQPGTTVTSGVGLTETVAEDGTFEVFGGNLFCEDQVSVTGTAKDGSTFTRSQDVQCDSEPAPTPSVNFIKIYDGGHYASYNITGEGFRPGTQVRSGVGTTATVASNGTFELFGGNLFCDRQVELHGTANDGSALTRTAPVECLSES